MVQSNKKQNIDLKKTNAKKLIFLKSTVIALGIVFFVLFFLLIFLKINQKDNKIIKPNCDIEKNIQINNEISQIIDGKKNLILLTESKKDNKENYQHVIILDKKCYNLINQIKFQIQ